VSESADAMPAATGRAGAGPPPAVPARTGKQRAAPTEATSQSPTRVVYGAGGAGPHGPCWEQWFANAATLCVQPGPRRHATASEVGGAGGEGDVEANGGAGGSSGLYTDSAWGIYVVGGSAQNRSLTLNQIATCDSGGSRRAGSTAAPWAAAGAVSQAFRWRQWGRSVRSPRRSTAQAARPTPAAWPEGPDRSLSPR